MEPRIEIRRLQLDYRVPPTLVAGGGGDLRARLDEVAARVLPVLLERALAPLDDGRLVVLRRVSSHVRLGALTAAGEVMPWAVRWAESLAAEVRRAVDEAIASGGAVTETAAAFAGPVEAIAHYVVDALAGRLDRWCWRPSLGVLATARRALDDTASGGGDPHRQALARPSSGRWWRRGEPCRRWSPISRGPAVRRGRSRWCPRRSRAAWSPRSGRNRPPGPRSGRPSRRSIAWRSESPAGRWRSLRRAWATAAPGEARHRPIRTTRATSCCWSRSPSPIGRICAAPPTCSTMRGP
jgi:hypothetical protein